MNFAISASGSSTSSTSPQLGHALDLEDRQQGSHSYGPDSYTSASDPSQQLITQHLAPAKRGARNKRPSMKAQQQSTGSHPSTPSTSSQPENGAGRWHETPPAQPHPYTHGQGQYAPSQWDARASNWDSSAASSSSLAGGSYAGGGVPLYQPAHLADGQPLQHQYYYQPAPHHPSAYGHSHSSSYDGTMHSYPPPPPSSHSRSSSGGHLYSPSTGPYALSPMPHYANGGLPVDASSPAAHSPLHHYAFHSHGYPPHFQSSSTPLEPFRPHPPPLPVIERASASPALSKGSVQSMVSADKDKDGKMKRTPRKYTKKADYWVENGGQGRKGPGKKALASQTSLSTTTALDRSTSATSTKKSALPTPPKSASTPILSRGPLRSASSQETLVAQDESVERSAGGELARLRSEEEEEDKLKEEKRPGWLKRSRREGRQGRGVEVIEGEGEGQGRKLDLWQPKTPVKDGGSFASTSTSEEGTTSGSGVADGSPKSSHPTRLISPLSPSRRASRPPMVLTPASSIPRTVSAPTLLTSSDGRVTLSSTQILSSEMAWLMPLNPRPVRPTTSISVEEDDESKQAREEKKRRRLAAFAKDGLDFFASPETERTRSLSRSQSTSNLVAAQVVGVGRVAMAETTLNAMEEAGTAQKVYSPIKAGRGKGVARSAGTIVRPNWPENEYPWGEPERAKAQALEDKKKASISLVERYLDGSSDEEDEDDDLTRFPVNPLATWRSDERTMVVPHASSYMELSSSRRGGKSSYGLIGNSVTRTRVRSARSMASLEAKSFDPSDARQALLLKRQSSSTFSMSQFRNVVSRDHLGDREHGQAELYDTSAMIGCVCREERDGDDIGMVECDSCATWHHLDCLGLDEDDLGDEWFCWKCAPGDQPGVPYADEEPLSSTASSALLRTPNLPSALPTFAPNNSPLIALSPAQSPAQSPIFGSRHTGPIGTPIQRFGTPRMVSTSSYTSMSTSNPNPTPHAAHSPPSSRSRQTTHDFGDSLGLGTPAAGPSRSSWDSGRILSTPKFADFDPTEEAFYDLGSTPSRHLGRELPFGGTPTSRKRSGPGPFGRLSAFTTPSQTQEFFHGLQASPRIPSSSGGPPPGLDHYPSSVDSSGPMSPYQPRWSGPHASPSVYGQTNRMTSASRTSLYGGGEGPASGATPRARMVSAMASGVGGERKGPKEHVRFGEPLQTMTKQQVQQRGLGLGMGQREEFGEEL